MHARMHAQAATPALLRISLHASLGRRACGGAVRAGTRRRQCARRRARAVHHAPTAAAAKGEAESAATCRARGVCLRSANVARTATPSCASGLRLPNRRSGDLSGTAVLACPSAHQKHSSKRSVAPCACACAALTCARSGRGWSARHAHSAQRMRTAHLPGGARAACTHACCRSPIGHGAHGGGGITSSTSVAHSVRIARELRSASATRRRPRLRASEEGRDNGRCVGTGCWRTEAGYADQQSAQ